MSAALVAISVLLGAAAAGSLLLASGGEATGHYCLSVVLRLALDIYPTLLHIVLPAKCIGALNS